MTIDVAGGVDDDLRDELGGVPRNSGSDEGGSLKSSLGGSLRGSLSSLPSIVITGERKTPEKLFGFKVRHCMLVFVLRYELCFHLLIKNGRLM